MKTRLRAIFAGFKRAACGLAVLAAGCARAKVDGGTNSTLDTIRLTGPTEPVRILLVPPSSPGLPHGCRKAVEIVAEQIRYEFVTKPNTGGMSTLLKSVPTLAVHDRDAKKICFADPEQTFYASDESGMKGYTVCGGFIIITDAYLEWPDRAGDEAAINQFTKTFTAARFDREWNKRATNTIGLGQAAPRRYFADGPLAGASYPYPKIEAIEVTDNVLHLELRNPVTKVPASFWIDLKTRKVIRSTVAGMEMDLSGVSRGVYAVPVDKTAPDIFNPTGQSFGGTSRAVLAMPSN